MWQHILLKKFKCPTFVPKIQLPWGAPRWRADPEICSIHQRLMSWPCRCFSCWRRQKKSLRKRIPQVEILEIGNSGSFVGKKNESKETHGLTSRHRNANSSQRLFIQQLLGALPLQQTRASVGPDIFVRNFVSETYDKYCLVPEGWDLETVKSKKTTILRPFSNHQWKMILECQN